MKFSKKEEKLNTEEKNTEEMSVGMKKMDSMQKSLKMKGVIIGSTILLLVAVLIVGSIAWYTRINNVEGMSMKAAEFEFDADYMNEDFTLSVADYLGVAYNKAAPGTGGVVPIRVSSEGSGTDVEYDIEIDPSTMYKEFQDRIMYYYYDQSGVKHIINPADGGVTIKGYLSAGEVKYEYIYWEWVYDLSDKAFCSGGNWYVSGFDYDGKTSTELFEAVYTTEGDYRTEKQDEFDAFDTEIGLGHCDETITVHDSDGLECVVSSGNINVTAYQAAMETKYKVTGALAIPVQKVANDSNGKSIYEFTDREGNTYRGTLEQLKQRNVITNNGVTKLVNPRGF